MSFIEAAQILSRYGSQAANLCKVLAVSIILTRAMQSLKLACWIFSS